MPFDSDYQPLPAPPAGRNWTDQDVCIFHGCPSIRNLMKMHGFPHPLAFYPTNRRLWRPQDQIDFRDALITERPLPAGTIPDFDEEAFLARLDAKKAAKEREPEKAAGLRRKKGRPESH